MENNELYLDCDLDMEKRQKGGLVVSYQPSFKQLTQVVFDGDASVENINDVMHRFRDVF